MAHIGTGVEYALHCLLWLVPPLEQRPSSRDLAELQGVPAAFMAKIFPKLEKAGIVESTGGIRGGYQLARAPEDISVLDVVDAVEGQKALFDCQEIRGRCALFDGSPPRWANRGVCGIHAVMINAQKAMREELARSSLASIAEGVQGKGRPASFAGDVQEWFADRQAAREEARITGMRARTSTQDDD
ncbi:HTH-type transcriptional repressor nsrR [Stenotrophomonas maltophilia SKK35]|uniref:Rrf2 family transcriptional regulator n=1 Tax=Stenotrophomonas maltophilia TaxID=40324 RepID=A0AAJ2JC44_STEMA|nr:MULTISPECIES: Rrf2 family transcriptional regulator [Stenotrophomonas]CCP10866.1 HTH-type transcriptional repressor nsrR [Stenotrophomonas maltophilia SKK35]MBH1363245.1 Rrf2 family transcriptional regulator [Stenotrophomonas maltophilia]MDQ7279577.1 Rrf2 family transcriptional regulator [Stenotrophomonas sp. Sm6012]MDT3469000.1 Rrf2 family transcriptional regulator [Stenotrophomonas maltophilia]HDS1123013.1 Rrf2 family transcriptional regulator [Stenotrophomonas maltophilia]